MGLAWRPYEILMLWGAMRGAAVYKLMILLGIKFREPFFF